MTRDCNAYPAATDVFGGKPIIRHRRISGGRVLRLLIQAESFDAVLEDCAGLDQADVNACLACAHAVIAHDRIDRIAVPGKARLPVPPSLTRSQNFSLTMKQTLHGAGRHRAMNVRTPASS